MVVKTSVTSNLISRNHQINKIKLFIQLGQVNPLVDNYCRQASRLRYMFRCLSVIIEIERKYPSVCSDALNITLILRRKHRPLNVTSAQFLLYFKVIRSWWIYCSSFEQLGFGWDVELLGVSSGSKLFAYGTSHEWRTKG